MLWLLFEQNVIMQPTDKIQKKAFVWKKEGMRLGNRNSRGFSFYEVTHARVYQGIKRRKSTRKAEPLFT